MFYYFLICPVCKSPSLCSMCSEDVVYEDDGTQTLESTIQYPNRHKINFQGVPKNIRTAFEAVLKTKHIDSGICAMSLRILLEKICKEQKATKKTLIEKIKELADNGILPQNLYDACTKIRIIGNDGAHGDDTVTDYEVDKCIEFIKIIVTYLYVLPHETKTLDNFKNLT